MTDKKFLYYTRFYPACNICGMREEAVSNYKLDEHYCRVCACITLRKLNNKKDEKERENEIVMFNKLEIKRPPLAFKCIGCYKPPVSYCRFHLWSLCEEHRGLNLPIIERKCVIYEKENLWKSCYWWESKCKKHQHKKKYYCKAENKMYCIYCFRRNHLVCNKKEIDNYFDENFINRLYEKLLKKFPEDPILKMIDDNKGIRSKYIIKQLRYFMAANIIKTN